MRKTEFTEGEYYHIYNRGVDKRAIFGDKNDLDRFLKGMMEFNTVDPIGSLYAHSFKKSKKVRKNQLRSSTPKLVEFVCYCLNPNHFHFLIRQETGRGVEQFIHRLSTGYTNYFNHRYKRSGSLFQGRYKSIHVSSNEYLLYLSAYINLNDRAHSFNKKTLATVQPKSSYNYFTSLRRDIREHICDTSIILDQFPKPIDYMRYAEEVLSIIKENKEKRKEIESILLEM